MKTLVQILNIFLMIAAFVLAGAGIVLYWEDRTPVMKSVHIKEGTTPTITDDSIIIRLAGDKRFGHCQFVKFSSTGWVVQDGYSTKVDFRFIDDTSPDTSFGKGKLDAGYAEFYDSSGYNDMHEVTSVGWSGRHNCRGEVRDTGIYWMDLKK
jgi:hypothetical protein